MTMLRDHEGKGTLVEGLGMKEGEELKLFIARLGGKSWVNKMVEEICSVQPMDANLMSNLIKAGSSEKELIEKGYEPVSGNRILWVLKDECED